jgi:hypothetical protein
MWYCIGKNVGTPQIIRIIVDTVLFFSVLGAFFGLKQHFFGFSDAEQQWFSLANFSNQVGGTERPMSFLTSPSEYANFLSLGITICFSKLLRGQKGYVLLGLFLAYALFLTGIRGAVGGCVGGCTFMWAIQGREVRAWLPRLVIGALVVGVGGLLGLQQVGSVAETVGGGSSGADMLNHQVQGLTDPLSKNSSLHGHAGNIGQAFINGIKMPIGYGLGASTIGSVRFGGAASFNAETDIATLFHSLGMIGGIIFIGVIVTCFRSAGLFWYHTRTYAPLAVMGVLVSSNGNWLTPGHYAQSAFIWIMIGCLERSWRDGRSVPGFTLKRKQSKSSIAIWKRVLARRLSGVSPSWEASYRRASQKGSALASETAQPLLDGAETRAQTPTKRLTPSAERALARAARENESELQSGLREQEKA